MMSQLGQYGKRVSVAFNRYGITLPDWIEVVLWSSGVFALIVFSLIYSIRVLSDYIDNDRNVAVNTSVKLNELFHPPQMVLSIPHYILEEKAVLSKISRHLMNNSQNCSQCHNLTQMSWDVWTDFPINETDFDRTRFGLAAAFTRKMLIEVKNGSNPFPNQNQDWMWPLVESAMYFLSWKYNLDRYLVPPMVHDTEQIRLLDIEYANSKFNGTHIYDHLKIYLLNTLCRTIDLGVWPYLGSDRIITCQDILIDHPIPTIIDNTSIWIPVPASDTIQHKVAATLWPWPKEDPVDYESCVWTPPGNLNNSRQMWLYSDPWPQYYWELDNNGGEVWPSLSGAKPGIKRFPQSYVKYSMAMKMKEKREGKDCYSDINPKLCKHKCSKIWAIQNFGCLPFSFHKAIQEIPHNHRNSSYCTQSDYSKYNMTQLYKKSLNEEKCIKECSDPCESITYNIQIYEDDHPFDVLGFAIFLRPIMNPFVEFSRYTKDQSFDLISNLGGVVSLFLNLSFLSICVFIIFCVNIVQHRRKKTHHRYLDYLSAYSMWQMVLQRNVRPDNRAVSQLSQKSCKRARLYERMKILRKEMEMMKTELNNAKESCGYLEVTRM